MSITVKTNNNYYEEDSLTENMLRHVFKINNKKTLRHVKEEIFGATYSLTTRSKSLEQVKIFGFKNTRNKLDAEEQLILKLYSKKETQEENRYIIQTGLFAGTIFHKGYQFNITTPYGDTFLKRMLNCVNDIYVDNQKEKASQNNQANEFQNIIAYLFIQSLEKNSALGLPQAYYELTQRSHKARGKIDLNAYFKNDFPFQGKLTTKYRERIFVQEIIDVLFLTCKKLEKKFGNEIRSKILGVYQTLKQNYSGKNLNHETIIKAKNNNALNNPIYSGFKNVLEYAEIILNEKDLGEHKNDDKLSTQGYLFDISQLFELYIEKLLNRHFTDWFVIGQEELHVYSGMFYSRKMLPDLVLKNKYNDQIMVFDAKFKKMRMKPNTVDRSDLDRPDFFQIHSYIQYYQPNVLLGGLLYPLSEPINISKTYSDNLFQNSSNTIGFLVDGIYVTNELSMIEIINNENEFLARLQKLIEDQETLRNNKVFKTL